MFNHQESPTTSELLKTLRATPNGSANDPARGHVSVTTGQIPSTPARENHVRRNDINKRRLAEKQPDRTASQMHSYACSYNHTPYSTHRMFTSPIVHIPLYYIDSVFSVCLG